MRSESQPCWHQSQQLPAPLTMMGVEASTKGITRIVFGGLGEDSCEIPAAAEKHLASAFAALKAYTEDPTRPVKVCFDFISSDFRKAVLRALQKVKAGSTLSYGELALRAGVNPQAARAVGTAMSSNPCPVLIPCHRVLAANQKLGGFTGGLKRKRALLQHEGALYHERSKALAELHA